VSERIPESLSAVEAFKLLGDDRRALLVDIRSSAEFLAGEAPAAAINIPWLDEPDWQINPDFVATVRALRSSRRQAAAGGDDRQHVDDADEIPLILICRSGSRSLVAGQALLSAGLRRIYHVQDGLEGGAAAACPHARGGCEHTAPREVA